MRQFDYCERLDPGFWAEPVNALSNVFFILFAYLAFMYLYRSGLKGKEFLSPLLLTIILFAIAIGSFMWHTFASSWAEMADVIPITIFMHLYLYFFARNIFRWDFLYSFVFVLSFVVVNYIFSITIDPNALNGSIAYIPALLYLFLMVAIMKKSIFLKDFVLAILIFLVSISLRSVDFLVCELISVGTHSLWHVLNAIFLYRLILIIIDAKVIQATKKLR